MHGLLVVCAPPGAPRRPVLDSTNPQLSQRRLRAMSTQRQAHSAPGEARKAPGARRGAKGVAQALAVPPGSLGGLRVIACRHGPPITAGGHSKENRAPTSGGGGGALGGLLAAGVAVAGSVLMRHLHSRSCELARQLTATRSELESKSSQLSDALQELEAARCACAATAVPDSGGLACQPLACARCCCQCSCCSQQPNIIPVLHL